MYEVELKASLKEISAEEAVQRALSLGFVYDRTLIETDTYYNGIDRNFMDTDEALRIRSCSCRHDGKEETRTAFITYKGPKLDGISSTRQEYETTVGDASTVRTILETLGYSPVLTVSKNRREFKSADGITLCVDLVKGLPPYIELEAIVPEQKEKDDALHRLFHMLHELGIPKENTTRKSYLEMLLKARTSL